MDLEKFGVKELSGEEVINLDGGGIIAGVIAAVSSFPLLFGSMTLLGYIDAIFQGLATPVTQMPAA